MSSFQNLLGRLRANLSLDKKVRRQRRQEWSKRILEKRTKAAKFAVSYSVWDGEELLAASIHQIRGQVDYINVVWQGKSWTGMPGNPNLKQELEELQRQGLIDELIEYHSLCNETYQEPAKRQLGLDAAIRAGCNYFMTMDTDEFYIEEQFAQAKKFMIERKIDHGFVLIKLYGSSPKKQWIHNEKTPHQVPFFTRIDLGSSIGRDKKCPYPYIADPSRQIVMYPSARFMLIPGIAMHHMTYIRKDLGRKMEGSSAARTFAERDWLGEINLQSSEVEDQFELLPLMEKWDGQRSSKENSELK
jgi:hypothetical protein